MHYSSNTSEENAYSSNTSEEMIPMNSEDVEAEKVRHFIEYTGGRNKTRYC